MDAIYADCKHYPHIPTFNHETYTRTVLVFDLVCGSPGEWSYYGEPKPQLAGKVAFHGFQLETKDPFFLILTFRQNDPPMNFVSNRIAVI